MGVINNFGAGAKLLGIAIAYSLSARIVQLYFSPHGEASIFFLASGIALASLLIGGNKYAIAIFAGAFMSNILSGQAIWSCAATAAGSALGALVGSVLVKRSGQFNVDLHSLQDVVRVFFWGGFVGSAVSASIGTATMYLAGIIDTSNYVASFGDWWMGDALGVVLMTSLILVWKCRLKSAISLPSARLAIEAVLIVGGTVLAGGVVFLGWGRDIVQPSMSLWVDIIAQGYWMLPFIALAALRLKPSGTTIVLLVVAAMGVTGAYQGLGIFANDALYTHLVSYWFYTVILALVGMALATYIAEQKMSEKALLSSETRLNAVLNGVESGVATLTEIGVIESFNPSAERIFGYQATEIIGKNVSVLMPDSQQAEHDKYIEIYNKTGRKKIIGTKRDVVARKKDGTLFHIELGVTETFIDDKTVFIGSVNDITERKLAEEEIKCLAFYDTLTKLPNRRLLNDRLCKVIASCRRSHSYGALMFLDLDNFKPLNDTHGHATGDVLLKEVARRIENCVRETDTVARFGGDEFVVVVNELHADKGEATTQAKTIAEKIRSSLSELYLLETSHNGFPITVAHKCGASIGVIIFLDEMPDDILKWADTAMYEAKEAGKNQIHFFTPEDISSCKQSQLSY